MYQIAFNATRVRSEYKENESLGKWEFHPEPLQYINNNSDFHF